MENSSEVLHAMERLVSSLLQANTDAKVVKTINIWVSYVSKISGTDYFYPYWEKSKANEFKARQVTFTGNKVSVAFPRSGVLFGKYQDRVFGKEITDPATLEKFQSGANWNLKLVELWGENKIYWLTYECQGIEIKLTETARDADRAAFVKRQNGLDEKAQLKKNLQDYEDGYDD